MGSEKSCGAYVASRNEESVNDQTAKMFVKVKRKFF